MLYVNQVTQSTLGPNDKGLTASMVNNYVKHGHVAKPIKKKYNAAQVARLIVITSLKTIFEISEIAKTLEILRTDAEWSVSPRSSTSHTLSLSDAAMLPSYPSTFERP